MLRTPDARLQGLPHWPYAPHYLDVDGCRMHHIDEGPRDAAVTVLALHGNPSWSYLYRYMIPVFTAAGLRVVAPDLIGFGRSDKPEDPAAHTWAMHIGRLLDLVDRLDLRNVMLVCQDWGGILGLTLPPERPSRFTRLLVMNTTLGLGRTTEGFRQWRQYANSQPDLAVGRLFQRGRPELPADEAAAYDAPFPDASYKAALRAFPNLVPEASRGAADAAAIARSEAARRFWREAWRGESFMAIGLRDPVLGREAMQALHADIRGCPPPLELPEAGHFVPEWGAPVARAALAHFGLLARDGLPGAAS